ncbi:MAG: 2-oxo-4-hydroxy-4-carboxy-5-ureidoimidazoline decarboxylase [Cellvibrionaceae bacterium]|nr:2-oxo-4-hydroxy-4-carboxy-5-ureidoimidazoline decarboxylase [Cellvibrionaceae bacterium]
MELTLLNTMPSAQAKRVFLDVCHCRRWAEDMCRLRPFSDSHSLLAGAAQCWQQSGEGEILEAFLGHKQIGDLEALRDKYQQHTQQEQGQVLQASEAVLMALHQLNQQYLDKFGFIFIVCATGKSAVEMLALLERRIDNSRAQEIEIAAAEQAKIIEIRLRKLLEAP